jgi:hypothetical protein
VLISKFAPQGNNGRTNDLRYEAHGDWIEIRYLLVSESCDMPISGDVIALYGTSSSLLYTDCRPLKTEGGGGKNLAYSEKGRIRFSWGRDKVSALLSLTLVVVSRLCFFDALQRWTHA